MIVNASETDIIRARQALVLGGLGAGKRPTAWEQYDYPVNPTFEQYLQAYERGGAGHGAVHKLLDKCWQALPRIKQPEADKETPWEKKTAALFKKAKVWPALRDLDRRNMVGRYAGLIYRVADSLPLREPIDRASKLVELVPVYEGQLRVAAWDSDPASATYGDPKMFEYRSRIIDQTDTQGQPLEWQDVHPSRVQIMAEGAVGDLFQGVPFLRAGYNALVDIEKISGGSAESYLKNSARVLSFEYDKDASVNAYGAGGEQVDVKEAHKEQVDRLNRSVDSAIVTQGAKSSVLQTHTSDPSGAFQLAANLFSASVQIPFTILFGQQTGRLASDEDQKDFAARAQSRQQNELAPVIEEFVTRMQAIGVIDAGEFEIEWPDLMAPSDKDKIELVTKMAAAAKTMHDCGQPGLFDNNELRKVANYEEQTNMDPPRYEQPAQPLE